MGLVGRKSAILASSVVLLSVCMTPPTAAQNAEVTEAGGATLLQRLILFGQRALVGTPADTPQATQTTAEEIEDSQIDSIEDLGNTTEPGVNVGTEGRGVNIRGLESDRVLTTIDGISIPFLINDARSSSTDADGGIDTFNFNSISTVDIVRGSDSSRSGSGALGGAMVLRTLEPDDLLEGDASSGGVAKTTYDSSSRSLGGSVAMAARRDGTSILFQGGYTYGHETDNKGTVGGQGDARSEPNPKDYDEHNLLFKFRQEVGEGHMIGLTAERYHEDTAIDRLTDEGATYSDLNSNEIDQRDRVSVDYSYEAPDTDNLVDRADLKFYWQKVLTDSSLTGTRITSVPGPWYRDNEMAEQSVGMTGSLEKRFSLGEQDHLLTLGLDVANSRFEQFAAGDDACDEITPMPYACGFYHNNQSDMPDVDAYRIGLFVDDVIAFGDSGFSLTPGLRFDWYDYRPQDTATYMADLPAARSDYQFSPKLRAGYAVNPSLDLFAQWSMAFKAPNVSQLYLDYDNAPFYRTIGNPELEPETSNGFEIGASFGDARQGGRVTAFYNKYRNFIDTVSDYSDPDYMYFSDTYVNVDRVRIYGFEARLHKRFDNGISIDGALAYANGVDEDSGDPINSVAPIKAVLGLGYDTESWGTMARLIAVGEPDRDPAEAFRPDGYAIVNLTGWWEPEQWKGLRISGGVYNLFDTEYYDAMKWRDPDLEPLELYSEPGRSFKVSLTQRF